MRWAHTQLRIGQQSTAPPQARRSMRRAHGHPSRRDACRAAWNALRSQSAERSSVAADTFALRKDCAAEGGRSLRSCAARRIVVTRFVGFDSVESACAAASRCTRVAPENNMASRRGTAASPSMRASASVTLHAVARSRGRICKISSSTRHGRFVSESSEHGGRVPGLHEACAIRGLHPTNRRLVGCGSRERRGATHQLVDGLHGLGERELHPAYGSNVPVVVRTISQPRIVAASLRSMGARAPSIKGETDRFVYRFVKP